MRTVNKIFTTCDDNNNIKLVIIINNKIFEQVLPATWKNTFICQMSRSCGSIVLAVLFPGNSLLGDMFEMAIVFRCVLLELVWRTFF